MVTVYTKNNCPACTATKSFLETISVDFLELNIEEDMSYLEDVVRHGYQQVPVVIVGDGVNKWSGHQPSKLMTLKK